MAVRHAEATWNGTLKAGNGNMKFGGGAFDGQYSFSSRFEEGPGTNPEKLICAAGRGLLLDGPQLRPGKGGLHPGRIHTTATVHLNKTHAGQRIMTIELDCEASAPGIDDAKFQQVATGTRSNCPAPAARPGWASS